MGRQRKSEGIEPQWTDRQVEVLRLISAGKTNPEIAASLGITLDGAKWHVREVLTKLGVEGREEAAAYWRERQRVGPRFARATGQSSWKRAGLWLAASVAVATAASVGLVFAAGTLRDEERQPERGAVFEISSDAGATFLLLVSTRDGRELARVPQPPFALTTAGRFVILQSPRDVRASLPDGTGDRLLHSAREGTVITWVYPSWDGSRVAVTERRETGGGDRVTVIDVTSGRAEASFDRELPAFNDLLGGFQHVWWHRDNRSITIGSGGVQVEGDYEFRQSLAHVDAAGTVRVMTVDASSSVSPDGELVLHGLPATPGCMGFVATHQLDLVDLRTGKVVNSVLQPEGGLKPGGWLPAEDRGPLFQQDPDAGCHPADSQSTLWELPVRGSPIPQAEDPFEQLRGLLSGPVIEVQCGVHPRTRWGEEGWSHFPGGRGGGGCEPISRPFGSEADPSVESGSLWVEGRKVADLGRFTLIGLVDLAP